MKSGLTACGWDAKHSSATVSIFNAVRGKKNRQKTGSYYLSVTYWFFLTRKHLKWDKKVVLLLRWDLELRRKRANLILSGIGFFAGLPTSDCKIRLGQN